MHSKCLSLYTQLSVVLIPYQRKFILMQMKSTTGNHSRQCYKGQVIWWYPHINGKSKTIFLMLLSKLSVFSVPDIPNKSTMSSL